ncbi:hypothetical protein E2C01_087334 [Portunus trituberculatus]|uniref:Uncharacterized protein n=1 Tax=Portunus trituberculatus TaxID=210409 RepID=A0A5B7JC78_PORTR|nr:hypothetical protein [Portunus trituberculatus]
MIRQRLKDTVTILVDERRNVNRAFKTTYFIIIILETSLECDTIIPLRVPVVPEEKGICDRALAGSKPSS